MLIKFYTASFQIPDCGLTSNFCSKTNGKHAVLQDVDKETFFALAM